MKKDIKVELNIDGKKCSYWCMAKNVIEATLKAKDFFASKLNKRMSEIKLINVIIL